MKNKIIERTDKQIMNMLTEIEERVWYIRHQNFLYAIKYKGETCDPEILKRAKASAKKVEEKYGKKSLRLSDWEYGLLSGKLSTLRWLIGEDWDMLDT